MVYLCGLIVQKNRPCVIRGLCLGLLDQETKPRMPRVLSLGILDHENKPHSSWFKEHGQIDRENKPCCQKNVMNIQRFFIYDDLWAIFVV